MESIFSLSLSDLQQRTSMKWQAYPSDVLPAWVAEMDARPIPAVVERVSEALALGDTGYPAGNGYQQAFARFADATWGWSFDPTNEAVVVPDVMQGIAAVLRRFTPEGSAVVVNPPVYPQFFLYFKWAERQVLEAALTDTGRLDLSELDATFSGQRGPKPAAYVLCNPHNPHGTVHTREELEQVAALAESHGVLVISDEIHAPLTDESATFVPWLSASRYGVTVTSASKSWNLAGLKAAVAIAGPEQASELRKLPDEVTHSASHLGIIAHAAALDHGRDWLAQVRAELRANRELVRGLLAEQLPKVRLTAGPGTYLAWLDCRGLGLENPYETFLGRKVALNNGVAFGSGGEGHVRLNLATSPEILTEVVRRMVG